ncbi:MAG: YigZ family protein [Clostridia bacterium]|nr:YigZ family protein [Clostridia bacterium]
MKDYKTIKQNTEATHVVERSKFIAHIRRVESREEAEQFIAAIKKEYWDARHNVYAYVLKSGESRCSDDGEPSGTSGMPTLDVLLGQGFSDVCVVTTRYFGGILLGTGGLVRAYSKAAALALEAAGSTEVSECSVFEAVVPYSYVDKMNRFLEENACVKESVDYGEQVRFCFYCRSADSAQMCAALTDRFHGEVHEKFLENAYKEL